MKILGGLGDLLCAVLLPEVVIVLLGDFLDHVQGLTHQLLLDHLQQFVLLQRFTRHVQGQIIAVDLKTKKVVSTLAYSDSLTVSFSLPLLYFVYLSHQTQQDVWVFAQLMASSVGP